MIIILSLIISSILFSVDIFLLYNFNSIINNTNIQILFETNFNESVEFLITYLDIKSVIGIIIIFFIFIKILNLKIQINSKRILSLLSIFVLIQIFEIEDNIKDTPLFRIVKSINISTKNSKIYKKIANSIINDVEIINNNSTIENIVVIIGESATSNHMGIYGYNLNTTPCLEKLEREGNIYKFIDVISPHVHTIASLQRILTFYNNNSNREWYTYNNIVDVMKKAGYKTYWFSNQESFGISGNVAAAIGNRSDIILFNKLRDSTEEAKKLYDEEIVTKSKKFFLENKNKNFIVYHLMGAHSSYKNRYPKEFEIFNQKDYNSNLNEKSKIERAEYDNAILYNDYVVNKIIELYKNKKSVIFYFSDHGEEVYDFRNYRGHGEDKVSKYMLEIPLLIYLSDEVKLENPKLEEKIKYSLNKPYMIDDIIHTILDIVGIETKEYDKTRSIINKEFNEKRERNYKGKSYDNYWKVIN